MSNLNLKTIENVSISEVKELDEFLKIYSKYKDLPEVERESKILTQSNGKLSKTKYDSYISRLKSYTSNAAVPTETEWAQVRTVYRETGNKKIAKSKEELELLLKSYSGTQSIEDSRFGKVTPKQVIENLAHAEKKVEQVKTLKVIVSIFAGVVGFVLLTILSKVLTTALFSNSSAIIAQLIAGVSSMGSLIACAWLANNAMGIFLSSVKRDRDLAELTEANNHDEIVRLQTAIKSAEQNVDKTEAQYGVEILYQSDFSSLVSPLKKLKFPKTTENLKDSSVESVKPAEKEEANEQSRPSINSIKEEVSEQQKVKLLKKTEKPKVEDSTNLEKNVEKSIESTSEQLSKKSPKTAKNTSKNSEEPEKTTKNQ